MAVDIIQDEGAEWRGCTSTSYNLPYPNVEHAHKEKVEAWRVAGPIMGEIHEPICDIAKKNTS